MANGKRLPACRMVVALLLALSSACGDGDGRSSQGVPRMPRAGDPAFGAAGNVLISDRGHSVDDVIDQLWVGFNRKERLDGLVRLLDRGVQPFVGGRVVADAGHPLGFYFDPDTTAAAEVVALENERPLDLLKIDPEDAERERDGRWMVLATIERIVPAAD